MMEAMVEAVQHPAVLWTVLAIAVSAVVVEAYKASPKALWGDLIGDESDE